MSMSTIIVGFCPPDEKYKKMIKAYESCVAAGIKIPTEIEKFFNGVLPPDPTGMKINIDKASEPWHDDCGEGFEVEIAKLPKSVTVIRFYNSW